MSTEDSGYNLYVSFGQSHAHSVAGKTFNKDCLAVIKCDDYKHGRQLAFEYFGEKFATTYHESEFIAQSLLKYFPRGLMEVN